MLRQQYVDQPSTEQVGDGGTPDAAGPSTGRALPEWQVTLRRSTHMVLERCLGECFAPNARVGLLVVALIIGLLSVIAMTLSVGNALLVLLVSVVMRISCERGKRPRSGRRAR
jgi:hypothetical protein